MFNPAVRLAIIVLRMKKCSSLPKLNLFCSEIRILELQKAFSVIDSLIDLKIFLKHKLQQFFSPGGTNLN